MHDDAPLKAAPIDAAPGRRPSLAAGLVCFKGDSVLLIKIGKEHGRGEWSIPGGHVEWAETTAEAALRETLEETGIKAEIAGMIEVVDMFVLGGKRVTINQRIGSDEIPDRHLVLVDYVGRWISGDPVPGDDAMHAEFVPLTALDDLGIWSETLRIVRKGAQMLGLADSGSNS